MHFTVAASCCFVIEDVNIELVPVQRFMSAASCTRDWLDEGKSMHERDMQPLQSSLYVIILWLACPAIAGSIVAA